MASNRANDLDLREFVGLNLKFIIACGAVRPSKNLKWYHVLYSFIILGFWFFCALLSEFSNMVVVWGDINEMVNATFLFATHIITAMKVYYFTRYSIRVHDLCDIVSSAEFQPKNAAQENILYNDIRTSKYITKIFLTMCVITCLLWGIFPVFDKSKVRSLPLSGWYPYNFHRSPAFEITYVYQILSATFGGILNISMDTFISGTIMFVASQLRILNNSFKNLNKLAHNTDTKKSSNFENEHAMFLSNIRHHHLIIGFAEEFTFLFSKCIMAQIFLSAIVICMNLFTISLVPVCSFQFLSMIMYQACILLEIFLFCYYGNEVIVHSDSITSSVFFCKWSDFPKKFKRNILSFLILTQKPLKLYAWSYFTLSLETYTNIIKMSWSCFAVLRSMDSD